MIGKLTGTVGEQGDDWLILDVGGVGYLVHCTRRTLAQLGTGAAAVLWTYRKNKRPFHPSPTALDRS